MKNSTIVIIFITSIALLSTGCKKTETENQCDVCNGAVPISAEFFMEEGLFLTYLGEYFWHDTDSMGSGNPKRFRAKYQNNNQNISYYWEIDNEDNSSNEPEFGLQYFPQGQHFNVTLWVEGTPRNDCYPEDDGIDSLTRSFYTRVVDLEGGYADPSNIDGYYEYTYQGIHDTLYLKEHDVSTDSFPFIGVMNFMHNFPPGFHTDTTSYPEPYSQNYNGSFHAWSVDCPSLVEDCDFGIQGHFIYDNNTIEGTLRKIDTIAQEWAEFETMTAHKINF